MPREDAATPATGRILVDDHPPTLRLIVGTASPYRALDPVHELYDTFALAWEAQQAWDDQTHFAYWQVGLRVWPVSAGQVPNTASLARWVDSWRRWGLSDEQIADRLGYPRDTLRRKGVFAYADEIRRTAPTGVLVPRTRLPLILGQHEDVPHPEHTWIDPRLSFGLETHGERKLRDELQRLTRQGPRGRIATEPA